MRADVIDVSHYQHVIDSFAGAKAIGIKAVIAKATEGTNYRDPTFETNRNMAHAAGLLFGAYHFIRPGDAWAQADFFLKTVGDPSGLCLVLDWEDPRVPISAAQQFCERVAQKTGGYPVMYSYGAMLRGLSVMSRERKTFWSKTKLWIAEYNATLHEALKEVWPHWWLWQFTGDGAGMGPHDIPGVGKNVDVSMYNGDPNKLAFGWATQKGTIAQGIPVKSDNAPAKSDNAQAPIVEGWLSYLFKNFYRLR